MQKNQAIACCGQTGFVIDSRDDTIFGARRRRRECGVCNRRWTTFELGVEHHPKNNSGKHLAVLKDSELKILQAIRGETPPHHRRGEVMTDRVLVIRKRRKRAKMVVRYIPAEGGE